MQIPLTRCGFRLQLRNPQHLNLTKQSLIICLWISQTVLDSASTVADSAKLPIFGAIWSGAVFQVFLRNPKQRRRSKKSSKVANSATKLFLACCEIRLQCTERTVWPRNKSRTISLMQYIPFKGA